MCTSTLLTKIISFLYTAICILLPITYMFLYIKKNHKKKRKNYRKAFFIAMLFLLIPLFFKYLVRIDYEPFKCANCYLNNMCEIEGDEMDDKTTTTKRKEDEKTNTTTTTSSKSSTTTTKTTTTTKKKEKEYAKIAEPSGEKHVIGTSSKGYTIYTIDGVTYVDGYLIANKTYSLPKDYVPKNTYATTNTPEKACQNCLNKTAYAAFQEMKADASAVGISLWVQSGYRSYQLQKTLYDRYVARDGKKEADTYSARAGYSEHQTGECFDVNSAGRSFNGTKEAKWVAQNAYKYGYIIRYPEGKTDETGYIYESWHIRYVGTDLSYKLYNNGDWITMEAYFGLTSKYKD